MGDTVGQRQEQADYHSYLLRLWRVNRGQEGWRASLESAHTEELMGFSSLDALFDYLRRQLGPGPDVLTGTAEAPGAGEGGDEPATG